MIGVIVWSSAAKQKAVIWCEDQGALAYLHGSDNVTGRPGWPEAGDMVSLETELRQELRHAFNVRIIEERKFTELPSLLRGIGSDEEPVSGADQGAAQDRAKTAAIPQSVTKRPALRVVASQDNPQIESDAFREKHPTLFSVKSAGKLR